MRRVSLIRALLSTLLAALPALSAESAPASDDAQLRIESLGNEIVERSYRPAERRYDQPDAAEAFYRLKRSPLDPEMDTAQAYREARAAMRRMPRHSARSNRLLAASPESELPGLSQTATESLETWTALGPGNIGGRTRVMVIDPSRPATLYAAGVSGGVWKSNDGGRRWQAIGDAMTNIAVNALAMDPSNSRVLYAGTGEGYFREVVRGTALPLRGGGIFVSENAGAAWRHLASTGGSDFHWVNDIVISSNDGRRVYAATRTGVWRSLDRGESWRRVLPASVMGGCLDLALRPDRSSDYLFASCGSFEQARVYRKIDAETDGSWETVLADPGMGRTSLAVAPSDPRVVYALAASNLTGTFEQGLHAVFRSNASGDPDSWQAQVRNSDTDRLNRVLLSNPITAFEADCGYGPTNRIFNMGWYTNVIAVDPHDPERVWVGGVDLFRSDDGGRNWGLASYWWAPGEPAFAHADHHGLVFHPGFDGQDNQILYSLNDGGIFRTRSARAPVARGGQAACDPGATGLTWESLNHGYGVTQFYYGAPYPDGERYLGGTQDNGTVRGSDAGGADGWERLLGGDGGYVAVDPTDSNVLYAATQNGAVYRSTDGGQNFVLAVSGITSRGGSSGGFEAVGENFLFISPFVMDPSAPRRLWTGGRRLWRTDDGARSWRQASAPLASSGKVSAIAVAPTRPTRVLAGTSEGRIHRTNQALRAAASTEWHSVRPRRGYLSWLTFDPGDPDVVYATYAGFGGTHVWRSLDGGASWKGIDGSGAERLPDIPVHSIVVDPGQPDRLFVGTDLGVFVTTDGGESWAVENTGFASAVTEALALSPQTLGGATLFAFTHGRGAWRVKLTAGEPEEPPGEDPCAPEDQGCLYSESIPGFRFRVWISGSERRIGRQEGDCIAETLCVSGAMPGRTEVFLRVMGPRPNGYLWATIVRFTPSQVEVEIEQLSTGDTRSYLLDRIPRESEELPGLVDREAFLP